MKKQLKWNVTLEDRKWKVEVGTSWNGHTRDGIINSATCCFLSLSVSLFTPFTRKSHTMERDSSCCASSFHAERYLGDLPAYTNQS